jgi:four helix bundle protein
VTSDGGPVTGDEGVVTKVRTHKDLTVWQDSMSLVVDIYRATEAFPRSEIHGLTSQLRRAAVSVPSNIAEGAARNSSKEFAQFLYIALSSLAEVETQLLISERLGFIRTTDLLDKAQKVRRMLVGLIRSIRRKGTARHS